MRPGENVSDGPHLPKQCANKVIGLLRQEAKSKSYEGEEHEVLKSQKSEDHGLNSPKIPQSCHHGMCAPAQTRFATVLGGASRN